MYPPYCSRASYLVSNDAVAAILYGSRLTKGFHVEDALYTGIVAENVGIQKISQGDVFLDARHVS
ncbi:hypothetical protein AAVH_09129 [Aphelenchoides avenae]|nr:hypothetical protein AAVH_09129 [Aphelenchus avenae]